MSRTAIFGVRDYHDLSGIKFTAKKEYIFYLGIIYFTPRNATGCCFSYLQYNENYTGNRAGYGRRIFRHITVEVEDPMNASEKIATPMRPRLIYISSWSLSFACYDPDGDNRAANG